MVNYVENRGMIKEKTEVSLEALETSLDAKIKRVHPDGCFVRLSTRSPKDAVYSNPLSRKLVMEEIFDIVYDDYKTNQILSENGEIMKSEVMNSPRSLDIGFYPQQNELLKYIRVGMTRAMKVTNGKECLDLLLKSERTLRDLRVALKFPKLWNMQLIIREFDENVELKNEFRGFVYDNKLNAISQYDKDVYYKDLNQNKDDLDTKLYAFWDEKIKDVLKDFGNYVIDFVIIENEVKVIELNPFDHHTGGCCFTWERDMETFKSGPFEFRLVKDVPHLKHLLWSWEDLIIDTKRRAVAQKKKDKIVLLFILIVLGCVFFVGYALFEHFVDMMSRKVK